MSPNRLIKLCVCPKNVHLFSKTNLVDPISGSISFDQHTFGQSSLMVHSSTEILLNLDLTKLLVHTTSGVLLVILLALHSNDSEFKSR